MNNLIISNLQVLLKTVQASLKDIKDPKEKTACNFRIKAYQNAIKAITNCDHELISGKDAEKLPGIGKKTAEKIQEIIASQLGVDAEEVTPEASFVDDLGADSLDTVELIMSRSHNDRLSSDSELDWAANEVIAVAAKFSNRTQRHEDTK